MIALANNTNPSVSPLSLNSGLKDVIFALFFVFSVLRIVEEIVTQWYNGKTLKNIEKEHVFQKSNIGIIASSTVFLLFIVGFSIMPTMLFSEAYVGINENIKVINYAGEEVELNENYTGTTYIGSATFSDDLSLNDRIITVRSNQNIHNLDMTLKTQKKSIKISPKRDSTDGVKEKYTEVTINNRTEGWFITTDYANNNEPMVIKITRDQSEYTNVSKGDCIFSTQLKYHITYYRTTVLGDEVFVQKYGTIPFVQFGKESKFPNKQSSGCYAGDGSWVGLVNYIDL